MFTALIFESTFSVRIWKKELSPIVYASVRGKFLPLHKRQNQISADWPTIDRQTKISQQRSTHKDRSTKIGKQISANKYRQKQRSTKQISAKNKDRQKQRSAKQRSAKTNISKQRSANEDLQPKTGITCHQSR